MNLPSITYMDGEKQNKGVLANCPWKHLASCFIGSSEDFSCRDGNWLAVLLKSQVLGSHFVALVT